MTKEAIAKAPKRRVKRGPIGQRSILSVLGKDPNYEYRIVNDMGDRVLRLQAEDWELVEAETVQVGDKRLGNPGSTSSYAEVSVGQGVKAYVMRKPKEWHEEDQAEKQERVNQIEAATKQEAKSDGNYGKIEITRS